MTDGEKKLLPKSVLSLM